ncbi:unnamed protein product [Prorocentrum cordatum]|uniref:Uncharacterized protein n=1 Tax=Prorocentrum cordatum TaxID=2364126 RepID=A0ABN9PVS3_9DINO|nr:unnamed protein product [Polarella glacialis]
MVKHPPSCFLLPRREHAWGGIARSDRQAHPRPPLPRATAVCAAEAEVRETEAMDSPEVASDLVVGSPVRVLEVVHLPSQRRLRGRLEHPAGWISLLNTATGARWAQRVGPLHPKAA